MSFDQITREDVERLLHSRGLYRVSVYLPTVKAGPETRENPIRLKNLLRRAEEDLEAAGVRPTTARDMVQPGYELEIIQEQAPDLGDGLGIFIDDTGLRYYRLPVDVPEIVKVGDRFELKPLLRLLSQDGSYYLLALSMNHVRAFRGHHFAIQELRVPDMPRSMAEALWPDDLQKQAQFHSANTGISGRGIAIFHSTGDEAAGRLKEDIGRYFKMVDNAFTKAVKNENVPLVVASVDYLHPIYRSVSAYKTLLEGRVEGNPDDARSEELAGRAWPIVEGFYDEIRTADVERFGNLTGTGKCSTSLSEIVGASARGRVETLWAASGVECWGTVDDGGVVEHENQQAGDEDLLDLAAANTVLNSGKVFVVDREKVPGGQQAAAIFRY
jgi:hypothetical protein